MTKSACHACDGSGTDIAFGTPCSECPTGKTPLQTTSVARHLASGKIQENQMPAPTSNTGRKIDWKTFGAREASGDSETWRPKSEGDTITGKLAKVDTANTKWGEKTVIELSDVADGAISEGEEMQVTAERVTVWPTPGMIDALNDAEADVGQVITITLDELVDTGKGNPFKAFVVELV